MNSIVFELNSSKALHTLLMVIIAFFTNMSGAETQTLFKVGYDLQAPHRFTDSDGNAVGTDIERIKRIFEHTNIRLEFYEFPWKRILKLVETGQLDIAMAAANIPQRKRFAFFSDEAFKYGASQLFIKNDLKEQYPKFNSLSDLISTDLVIAIRQGASYSDEYDLLNENQDFKNRLLPIRTIAQAIRLAQKGRIDGMITNHEMLDWEFFTTCKDNIFYAAYDLSAAESLSSFLMFSKQTVTKEQVESVNQAMKLVKPSELTFDVSKFNTHMQC